MDSINIINPQFNNRRLQKITALFRFIELFFFLVHISRFTLQIPFNLNLSGEFFQRISASIFSPRFVFALGNVIVITLFLKSGCSGNKSSVDLCEQYVENNLIKPGRRENRITVESDYCRERKIRRISPENLGRDGGVKQSWQLKLKLLSTTERCQNIAPAAILYAKKEMTGEEFRRAVDSFIERQQRFLREEELSDIF